MPKPHSTPIGSVAIVALLLLSGAVNLRVSTAHADDCLTTPRSSAPNGSHWNYHLDSTKQRKCWYLRAADPTAQPASARIPVASHNIDGVGAPLPHIKMLAVKSQPAPNETTDEPVAQSAQEGSGASSTRSASPPSTSMETNAQTTGPAPAVSADPPAVGEVNSREPTAALRVARTDSDQATGNARAPNNAETSAGTGSPVTTPPELFAIFALGLVVAGFLYRIVMKIAAVRRRPIITDCPESYWIDDPQQHEWRDNHKHHGAMTKPDELIDDLNLSLIPRTSDYKPHWPIQTDDQWSENAVVKDRVSAAHDESRGRDKLEELGQDLHRLLRSPKAGASWPAS
jgi:hypothetical protein